jgi:hypothetical protein
MKLQSRADGTPRRVEVSSATFQLGHHHHKVNKQTKHFVMA